MLSISLCCNFNAHHFYFLVTNINGYASYNMIACMWAVIYRKTSNISRTLEGNKIVDNSDVVGASPVGVAPTTSSFST